MRNNPILLWTIILFAAHWVAGLAPGSSDYISPVHSLMLLIAGGCGFARYTPEAYQVVFHKHRNHESIPFGYGSHLGVYGFWLLSAGAFYTGLFGLLYVASGSPASWSGTAISSFGRFMMWNGFFLVLFSPDVGKEGFRMPKGIWVIVAVAIVLLASFLFGVRVGYYQAESGADSILPIIEPPKG